MRSGVPLALLVAATILATAGCREDTTRPPAKAGTDTVAAQADQIIYGMRHKVTTEGVRKADLYSDTAFTRPNDPRVRLRGVRLSFFDPNGAQNGTLTSRTGEYDLNGGEMIARGNAVLVLQGDKGPRTIKTEELHYDQKADRVWSDKATTMEEAGQTYSGSGFESNTKFSNLRVQQLRTSDIRTSGQELKF